jgi:hypothetical protein
MNKRKKKTTTIVEDELRCSAKRSKVEEQDKRVES